MNIIVYITILMGLIFGYPSTDVSKFDTASLEPPSIYDGIPQSRTEDGAYVLGYPDAPITIVGFEDFLCIHCQTYQPEIKEFIRLYVATGQARFEFRMVPTQEFSYLAFGIVECADTVQPGLFWEAHDLIFEMAYTTTFNNTTSPRDFANELGVDYDDIRDCLFTADQYVTDLTFAIDQEIIAVPTVGWRLGDGEIRFDGISRAPSAAELGELIRSRGRNGAI